MLPAKAQTAGRVEWLPAERLGQFSLDARLRVWLIGKGLLTQRLRSACGGNFTLRLLDQWSVVLDAEQKAGLRSDDNAGLCRDVEMGNGVETWVFARSIVPDSTLSLHPWLAELGDASLGETLGSLSGVERSSYEFACLPAEHPIARRALQRDGGRAAGLWARRSRLSLRGAPILVQELFLPALGRH